MDASYREGAPEAIEVRLPKVKGNPSDSARTEDIRRQSGAKDSLPIPWYFPSEVYLLATMNSVDRSVAPLDTALGRRFERIDAMPDLTILAADLGVDLTEIDDVLHSEIVFEPDEDFDSEEDPGAEPGYEQDVEGEDGDAQGPAEPLRPVQDWTPEFTAVALLRYLNDEIADRLGADFELGHAYFFGTRTWRDLAHVWDVQIWPQLRDRFGARPDQLAEILRADNNDQPQGYPFRRRRPGGTALSIAPTSALSDGLRQSAFRFLTLGRR